MSPVVLARKKLILEESEKANVPCELAAAAKARSAKVKSTPPCVRPPALRCSSVISIVLYYILFHFSQFDAYIISKTVVLKKFLWCHFGNF